MLTASKKSYPTSSAMSTANQISEDLDLEDIEDDIEFSMNDDEEFYSDDDYESNGRSSTSYHYGNGSKNNQRNGQTSSSNSQHHEESHDDNRKDHHNQLERKRRASIKGSYNELKETIPGLKGSKASRAVILQRAVDCIADLNQKNKEHYQCVDVLMRENEILERQVSDLQRACDRLDNEDELLLNTSLRQYNDENVTSNSTSYSRNPENTFRYLNNSNNASSAYSTSSEASSSNSSLVTGTFNGFNQSVRQSSSGNKNTSEASSTTNRSTNPTTSPKTTDSERSSPKTTTPTLLSATKEPLQFVALAASDVLQSIQNTSTNASQSIIRLDSSISSASSSSTLTLASHSKEPCQIIRPANATGNIFVKRQISNGLQSISNENSLNYTNINGINIRPAVKASSQTNSIISSASTVNGTGGAKFMLKINNSPATIPSVNCHTTTTIPKSNLSSVDEIVSVGQSGQLKSGVRPQTNYLVKKTTVISSQPAVEAKTNKILVKKQ